MAVSFLLIYGDDMMRYNYVYTVKVYLYACSEMIATSASKEYFGDLNPIRRCNSVSTPT